MGFLEKYFEAYLPSAGKGDVFSTELSQRILREAAHSQQNQLPGM